MPPDTDDFADFSGTKRSLDGTAALPGHSFWTEVTLGLYRIAAGVLGFAVGGVEVARLVATGLQFAANGTGLRSASGNGQVYTDDVVGTISRYNSSSFNLATNTASMVVGGAYSVTWGVAGEFATNFVSVTPTTTNINDLGKSSIDWRSLYARTIASSVADGAAAVGLITDTINALANATAKLRSWRNGAAEKLGLFADGRLVMVNVDPTALGQVGMSTAVGRLRMYVDGSAKSVATLSDGMLANSGTFTRAAATAGGAFSFAHGLARPPTRVAFFASDDANQAVYSAGESDLYNDSCVFGNTVAPATMDQNDAIFVRTSIGDGHSATVNAIGAVNVDMGFAKLGAGRAITVTWMVYA